MDLKSFTRQIRDRLQQVFHEKLGALESQGTDM